MAHKINLGIQVIPIKEAKESYTIIDECIQLIQASKLDYRVTPFETVIEASYNDAMALIKTIHEFSLSKASEVVINLRIHAKSGQDVLANNKTEKYSS